MENRILRLDLEIRGQHLGLAVKCNKEIGEILDKNKKEFNEVIVGMNLLAEKIFEEIGKEIKKEAIEETIKEAIEDRESIIDKDLKNMLSNEEFLEFAEKLIRGMKESLQ